MNLNGILVPIITPFTANNQVDIDTLAHLVEQLIQSHVTGIVACGTTGEYYALSETERQIVLSTIVQAASGRCTLIAGISALSTEQAAQRAIEAKDLGYHGLMLSAPPYSLPSSAGVIDHFEYVANQTDLPMIMYNFPARVGVELTFESIIQLAEHPKIMGIKESSGNFSNALRLLQTPFKHFEVICGCDDQPLDFFFWGAKSWIAGSANVLPDEQVAIFQAAQAEDWHTAKQIFQHIYPILLSMESKDYNQKAKLGCFKGCIQAGAVRRPLANLSIPEQQAFLNLLNTI